MARTGIRPVELSHLLVEDLDLDAGWLTVRSKPELGWTLRAGRERRIPLRPELTALLQRVVGPRNRHPGILGHDIDLRNVAPREPGFFADEAAKLVAQGYTALKFDPFGDAHRQIDPANRRLAIDIVRAVREAVGPDVDLCVEAHDRFTVSHAVKIGRLLEPFDIMWYETPVHSLDIQATLEVARSVPVPVAVGERYRRMSMFVELLSANVVDIVQPELLSLGVCNLKRVCGIAEAAEAMVACHHAQSPFCTAVNAHVNASVANFLIQENFDDNAEPWTWDLLTGVPRVENGYITVPDKPGWGVELNEDEAAKHPYGERNFLRLFEKGWEARKPA